MGLKKIYEYLDYRKYLRDFYTYKKEKTRYFSYRYFNQKAGIKSPSLFKQVMDGERGLTDAVAGKFVKGLGLRKREGEFFLALVKYNQSKRAEEKTEQIEKILNHSGAKKAAKLDKSKYELYKNWWNLAIREMVGLADFREDPKWIAGKLEPKITAGQAKKALELIKKLKLAKYNKEGKLVLANATMTTGDEVNSLAIRKFHEQMISHGKEAINKFPKSKRQVSSLTMAVSKEELQEIKKRVNKFTDELLRMISKNGKKTEYLYELNVQLFPLMKEKK